MSNLGKQITELLMDSGKSAPSITHALKSLGNGSMQKGLARMSNYLVSDATAKGLTEDDLKAGLWFFPQQRLSALYTTEGLHFSEIKREKKY